MKEEVILRGLQQGELEGERLKVAPLETKSEAVSNPMNVF